MRVFSFCCRLEKGIILYGSGGSTQYFCSTPSICEYLIAKQIDLYGKAIMTKVLYINWNLSLFWGAIGINFMWQWRHKMFSSKSNFSPCHYFLWITLHILWVLSYYRTEFHRTEVWTEFLERNLFLKHAQGGPNLFICALVKFLSRVIRREWFNQISMIFYILDKEWSKLKKMLFIFLDIDLAIAKSEALVNNTCKQKKLNRVMLNGDDNENGFKTNRSN